MTDVSLTTRTDLDEVARFLRELLHDGRDDDAVTLVLDLLRALRDKNTELELRVRKLIKERYGRKREGISADQLSLFLEQLGAKTPDEATAEAQAVLEANDEEDDDQPERKRRSRGRRSLPADLPRITHKHQVEGPDRICARCGKEKSCMGHEKTEVLELIPAQFVVHEHLSEKLVCKPCGDGFVVAEAPAKLIDGGRPGPGLMADVLVSKYRDSLPLNRQSQRYARLGVELPRSTLCDWVEVGAGELMPIADRLRERTLTAEVLKTDGTGLDVLDRTLDGNKKRGMLYAHVGDHADMFFAYAPNQSKEAPQAILAGRVGPIVADAAKVYDGLFTAPGSRAVECGCWMHARRPFAGALDAGDTRAAIALSFIKKLYVGCRSRARGGDVHHPRLMRTRGCRPDGLHPRRPCQARERLEVDPVE